MEKFKYVIVGGVAAGASVAARLRRLDEHAEIIMIDKGPHVSFSNCSLPYRLSNIVDSQEKLLLMDPKKFLTQFNVDVRVNSEAININEDEKKLKIRDLIENKEYDLDYDKLVIAPGAKAIVPPFNGLDEIDYFTLKTVVDSQKIVNFINEKKPKHITVVGGGFIGVEVVENLIETGIEVTLIEGSNQLLQPFDYEMSLYANTFLEEKGVKVILGKLVDSFKEKTVILKDGQELNTDAVILSIGVVPETSFLAETNIKLSKSRHIIVNDNYQTSNEDIYAAGDAILVKNQLTEELQPLALAGPANKQGRLIADHIKGRKVLNKGYIGSSVIKIFDYTFAATGLNEKQINSMENPFDYDVVYGAPKDKVSLMPEVNDILFKLIFEKETGKVLGAQAISKGNADKRIDVIATAIKFNANVYDLSDLELTYAPHHGTGKDAVNKMGYQASELVENAFKKVNFSQIYDLLNEDGQFVDVREEFEYENGHIKGFINIPRSQFRNKISSFDKDKKIYVNCLSGQRSYNVVKALRNLGFDAYNISGGYKFVSEYERQMKKINSNRKEILV